MDLPKNAQTVLAGITTVLEVGVPTVIKTQELGKAIGANPTDINRMRRLLEYLGSLDFQMQKNPHRGITTITYTLKDTPEQIAKKIGDLKFRSYAEWRAVHGGEKSLFENGTIKPSAPEPDPVVYIAEPREIEAVSEPKENGRPEMAALAPLRKSEPRALVEAARQYLSRSAIAMKHIDALIDAGITTRDQINSAIHLNPDPRFETVALVLPYIDELEKRCENLERLVGQAKDRTRRAEELEIANRKLREQNERLLAKIASGS